MPADFTVIMAGRLRFGDRKIDPDEVEVDRDAPSAGIVEDFPFSCPNVDSSQIAVLQFEHRGSTQRLSGSGPRRTLIPREHPVIINGQELAGGIPATAVGYNGMPLWSSRVLLIPAGVLRAENVLRFIASNSSTGLDRNFDNFTLDNVVVLFKSRASQAGPGTLKP